MKLSSGAQLPLCFGRLPTGYHIPVVQNSLDGSQLEPIERDKEVNRKGQMPSAILRPSEHGCVDAH